MLAGKLRKTSKVNFIVLEDEEKKKAKLEENKKSNKFKLKLIKLGLGG